MPRIRTPPGTVTRKTVRPLLAAVFALSSPAMAAPPSPCPLSYALFGLKSIRISHLAHVEARADAGLPLATQIGVNQGTIDVARGAVVRGVLASRTIRLQDEQVDLGAIELFCAKRGTPGRFFRCSPLSPPLVAGSLLPQVAVFAGKGLVRPAILAPGKDLPAGRYGRLLVPTGKTMRLGGGTYAFSSVTVGEGATLECVTDCTIAVRFRVSLRPAAQIRSSQQTGGVATVRLLVQSDRGTTFVTRTAAKITGIVYAPSATVRLGAFGTYIGSFIGRHITIGENATVTGPASPPMPCPNLL
jgi:hypothetical protein